jgi:AhpD family alkylhydroperoxidase
MVPLPRSARNSVQVRHHFDARTPDVLTYRPRINRSSCRAPTRLFFSPGVRTLRLAASHGKRVVRPGSCGSIPRRLREQIALAVGETNACNSCVAAHTALGRRASLTEGETKEAQRASSHDGKEQAASAFARKITQGRGFVADEDVEQLRRAGYTEMGGGEIGANVALNLFTNDFNHVAAPELEFPSAPDLAA